MRLALLGCDHDTWRIVRAIGMSSEHSLASIHHADEFRDRLIQVAPDAQWLDHWEALLISGEVDAVIVTPHGDTLVFEDQLRKLVQAKVPLIVVHGWRDALLAYELEMMREEAGGLILPFFPGWGHPALARVADILSQGESSPVGQPEQIVMERYLTQRDRSNVLAALARDISIVRRLIGQITSISAVGGEPGDTSLPHLSVSLTGTTDVAGRWSVAPATEGVAARLTLVGSQGTVVITAHDESQRWTLRIGNETAPNETFESFDEARAILEQLDRERSVLPRDASWGAICHDLDAAEQVERSLRRKRTIELRRDSQNEEGAFKGIMSAGGCLLLTLALVVLMVFALIEGIRLPLLDTATVSDVASPVTRTHLLIRLWPVYPLVAFLLLQFLVFVAKQPKAEQIETVKSENEV